MHPSPVPITVLLVEDDEDDALITRDILSRQNRVPFKVDWHSDYDLALVAIREQRHDVYLIDYRLGEHTGLDLIRHGFATRPRAPVIMLTGQTEYEIDLEAAAAGVTDFLLKQELNPTSLERSIRYAISHHDALRELARSEERYALAARAINDGIWDWDLQTDRLYVSDRWLAVLGRSEFPDGEGPPAWFGLVHPDDLPGLRAALDAHLRGETSHMQSEHRMLHADGDWRWVLIRGLAVRDASHAAVRLAGSLSDVTERREALRRLEHDALHDSLTGLPNRALFMDRLEHALRRYRRNPTSACAVLFLDIDHFKLVNDSLSHAVGDRLLIESAERIVSVLRPSDTVARLGGDEFTILIENTESDQAVQLAASAATRVHRSLSAAFDLDGHRLFATAAIGIAVSVPGISATDLIRNADTAMYEAKRLGRGRWSVFDEGMHRRVVARMDRESALRQAVESSLLRVCYQPEIDLATGRLRGFEALARWPDGWPPIPPAEFIPLAEETGLITVLGRQVLRTALDTLGYWRRSGLVPEDVTMSVNVSGRQLEDPDFSEHLFDAINDAGIPGTAVRLEITESAFMREPERTSRLVSELSATGVGFELDDFGTGYSSLGMLRQFPLKALKIDRSFVSSIEEDEDSGVIVRSILAIAHNLGLEVIAEGIERMGEFRVLRSLGCEYGQGYLFSPALDTDETESLLKEWSVSQTGTASTLADRPTWSADPETDPGFERLEDVTARPSR